MTTAHPDPHPWLPAAEWERRLDMPPGSLVGVLPALSRRGRVDGHMTRTPQGRVRHVVYRFGPYEQGQVAAYLASREGYARAAAERAEGA